jgi:hypothetical protein
LIFAESGEDGRTLSDLQHPEGLTLHLVHRLSAVECKIFIKTLTGKTTLDVEPFDTIKGT